MGLGRGVLAQAVLSPGESPPPRPFLICPPILLISEASLESLLLFWEALPACLRGGPALRLPESLWFPYPKPLRVLRPAFEALVSRSPCQVSPTPPIMWTREQAQSGSRACLRHL